MRVRSQKHDDLFTEEEEITFYKNIEENDTNCWEWIQKRYEMLVSSPKIEDYEKSMRKMKSYGGEDIKELNKKVNELEGGQRKGK